MQLGINNNNKFNDEDISEKEIHDNVIESFANINMSCDNIINSEYTPTKNFIDPEESSIFFDESPRIEKFSSEIYIIQSPIIEAPIVEAISDEKSTIEIHM